jgi:hypothetical protein
MSVFCPGGILSGFIASQLSSPAAAAAAEGTMLKYDHTPRQLRDALLCFRGF